ncbi:MAG: unusual protein kinase [Acidobacteria bacterium]|nr:unusual protein kinase [Acidobacteriota bacterium]
MFGKVLFTLDGILRDIAGGEISLDEIIAGYLATRWLAGFGTSPLPLGPGEWASLMASASLYGCRLWFQGLE